MAGSSTPTSFSHSDFADQRLPKSTLFQDDKAVSASINDGLEVLLRFAAAMLSAGGTASQARRLMDVMANQMGFTALSVSLNLRSVVATARCCDERVTLMREVEPPSINASRIGALEQLARAVKSGGAPEEITAKLAEIDAAKPHYSVASIGAIISVACGAFAFLNGGGALEMMGAAVGSGVGQWLRSRLSGGQLNQYGVTLVSAIAAASVYALIEAVISHFDFGLARHTSGSLSSILFLLPGFPLVTALLDMLQYQTLNAISRFAHAVMIILSAAVGFGVVSAVIGFDETLQQPLELTDSVELLLRGIASFAGAYAFAMLFNSSPRALFAVGILALVANELRLGLVDAGMMLAPATFFGSLAVGLAAPIVHRYVYEPLIAIAVPGIIIMMPGSYALQTVILFHEGQTLDAIRAGVLAGFAVFAIGIGLAVARFLNRQLGVSD
jgi:uncharacterized membrane protein YjjP (DUF1212 family)